MNITNNKRYLYLDGKSEISIELDTCPFLKNNERKHLSTVRIIISYDST